MPRKPVPEPEQVSDAPPAEGPPWFYICVTEPEAEALLRGEIPDAITIQARENLMSLEEWINRKPRP